MLASERRHYICNIVPYWLSYWEGVDTKWTAMPCHKWRLPYWILFFKSCLQWFDRNMSRKVQVMAWCQTDNKSLPLTQPHDDVIKWKHFPRHWSFVRGRWIPLTKGQWRGALMFSFMCAWTSGWANNRDIGDLRRHRAHSDVTAMYWGTSASHV